MHKVVSYSYKTSREGAWHYWWLFITTTLHASLKLVVAMEVLEIQICVRSEMHKVWFSLQSVSLERQIMRPEILEHYGKSDVHPISASASLCSPTSILQNSHHLKSIYTD